MLGRCRRDIALEPNFSNPSSELIWSSDSGSPWNLTRTYSAVTRLPSLFFSHNLFVHAMSSLQIDPRNVYQGFWIDWSHGRVIGSTITTTQTVGILVVALLAVIIQATGSHLWDIVVFSIHANRVQRGDNDGMYYQQQVLLRNNNGPGSILLDFTRISAAWRHLNRRPYYRNIYILFLAAFIGSGFIVAGILSSFVVSGLSIDILARSSLCGTFNPPDRSTERHYALNMYASTLAYSRSCYTTIEPSEAQCSVFATKSLPFNVIYNVSCPFENHMCKQTANGPISLDTGLLDSHEIFGLNARLVDRVTIRKKTTCSPITTDGFSSIRDCAKNYNASGRSPLPLEQCIYWNYGLSRVWGADNAVGNETLSASIYTTNRTSTYTMM